MNINAEILNKTLANRIHQYINQTPRSSGIYPMNAKILQNIHIDMILRINKLKNKKKYDHLNRRRKNFQQTKVQDQTVSQTNSIIYLGK